MATRIVLHGGEHLVVAADVQQVATALHGGALATLGRPGEGAPEVVVNPANILYLEHFEDQSPFIDTPD
jgi:hypothetical protein